jgi:sugar phosphate isomerase/epimerase
MCIDTGHANNSGVHVPSFIRLAGDRLKCTHVNDNLGDKDTHLPPFMGTVDWRGVMSALRELGYDGDFSCEIGPWHTPFSCRDTWYRYIYSLGMDLLSLK